MSLTLLIMRIPMLLLLSLTGCGAPPTARQCAKLMTDEAVIERCGNGGMGGIWTYGEDCYPTGRPERMTGIVIVQFERSEFMLSASKFTPDMRKYTLGTWLDWSNRINANEAPRAIKPGAYLITFEGRRSACPKPAGTFNGYGHMREYRHLAIVDRLISWKQVARLPDPFQRK